MATLLEKRGETLAELPEWRKLLEHFELTEDRFAYIPLLVPDDSWAEVCERSLTAYLSAKKKKLCKLAFTESEDFKNLAGKLFDLKFGENIGAIWITAPIVFRKEQIEIWQAAWREATARLNQYRNPLREKFPVTFIFVGGFWTQEITRTMAPDLWSIRTTVVRIEPPAPESTRDNQLTTSEASQQFEVGTNFDADYALKEAKRLHKKKEKEAKITTANLFYRAADGFHIYGRLQEAQKAIKEAIKIYRSYKFEKELANSLNIEGIILYDSGKLTDAIKRYEEAAKIYERLELTNDLAMAYGNKGVALYSLGRLNEAVEKFNKAIAMLEKLVNEQGRIDLAANDLAKAYGNKGNALYSLGRLNEAVEEFNKAIAMFEKLVNEQGRIYLANDLAMTYMNKGVALKNLGRLNESVEEFDKAIAGLEELVNKQGRIYLANDLAMTYWGKGNVLVDLDKPDEAIGKYGEAIKLWDECLQRNELHILPNLFTVLYLRVKVLLTKEDWHSVAEDTRRALNLRKEIFEHPDFSEHFKTQISDECSDIIELIREVSPEKREEIYIHAGEDGEMIRRNVEGN